ncbi:MAG: hypothetical protein QM718_08250 [Steroidobacteraceae bacterium]
MPQSPEGGSSGRGGASAAGASATTLSAPGRSVPIARLPAALTVFVGRTLRGPANQPLRISSFADFQQRFGGLWQPAPLTYAIEQFFENGGREAIVMRVTNGGRAPTLDLPAAGGVLKLVGVQPGTREYLRASVDYDGIDARDTEYFNLVVQRLRAPASEQIEDQEIFRRVTVLSTSTRCVREVLAVSQLVRVRGALPLHRPDRTLAAGGAAIGYVGSNGDGDDGDALTDYDLIGSPERRTGLVALDAVEHFNFLYVPPLSRERDVGLATLLVARRLCRRRQALLLVDPPAHWGSVDAALEGLADWGFHSEDALMYFPRMLATDRLRGRVELFGSGAAAAGMIARADETSPVWSAAEGEDALLRPGLRPAVRISEAERRALAQQGVNALQSVRAVTRLGLTPRTLVPDTRGFSDWRYLSARRFALFVSSSIEAGTHWAATSPKTPALWRQLRAQVVAFLEGLDQAGAFVGRSVEESYFVICDHRLNDRQDAQRVKLLYGFAASRPGDFHAFLLVHASSGSHTAVVSVNRLATGGQRLKEEIETSILRGVGASGTLSQAL